MTFHSSFDSNIPQLHPLQLTHLLSIHIQAGVQVGGRVTCHEHREQASVLLGVGAKGVTKLEIKFETPMTLVTS